MRLVRAIAIALLAIFFIGAGVLHFVKSGTYARIIPAGLPSPFVLVYVSGACEILGGIGVIIPRLRRWAGYGLIALLIAVFPANVSMALHPMAFSDIAAPAALYWRLPLQLVIIAWVWYACLSVNRHSAVLL